MSQASHQRGVATLMTAIVLLALMSLVAITLNRSGVMEHRMAASSLHKWEAQATVEGALSWFAAWMDKNTLTAGNWTGTGAQTYTGPPVPPSAVYASGATYAPSLQLTRTSIGSSYFKVTASVSTADAAASMSAVFFNGGSFVPDFSSAAPMVNNGCLSQVAGSPDAYPNNVNGTLVSYGSTLVPSSCVDTGHLDLHGGTVASVSLPNATGDADIWEYYMGSRSLADFVAVASTSGVPGSRYYYLNGANNWGGGTYGSASAPAVLVMHSGCGGKPSGGTTVYGLVLYLTTSNCQINGWNNFTLYGSLAFNGDVEELNSDVQLYGWSQPGGGGGAAGTGIGWMPGSWRDF
jgi:hypothetical protein